MNSSETSPLFLLNDYCFIKIFKLLDFNDYVNLANTCYRLRDIANSFGRFKNICVRIQSKRYVYSEALSNLRSYVEITNILSVIGEQILSIKIVNGNEMILKAVRDNCQNLNSIHLEHSLKPLLLQGFQKLKELKVVDINMGTSEYEKCFATSPNIEILECNVPDEGFMKLLKMLPKLKSIRLGHMPYAVNPNEQFHRLLHLDGLTRFSFLSSRNCDNLLNELANNYNLVELDIAVADGGTFNIIKLFQNLEVLCMQGVPFPRSIWFPEATVFPPKLKRIKFERITISCRGFLSMVKQLNYLEVFDLRGKNKFRDIWEPGNYFDNISIAKIREHADEFINELNQRKRTLKIIYENLEPECALTSDHLVIINRSVVGMQSTQNTFTINVSSHLGFDTAWFTDRL